LQIAAVAALWVMQADAADHEVLTRANQWAPVVLFVEPGDSVVWVGMTGHETELIAGMGPEDVMLWRSELGEEGFRVTFVQPGAYIYKCHVHLNAGMIGAIVVGDGEPDNLAEIDAALLRLGEERAAVERIVARMKRRIARR
jgi:pseudoazurin